MLRELVLANRSYRRFDESHRIETDTLRELVDLARLSPSAGNRQPLKFLVVNDADTNGRIFPHLSWAGYLRDWPGPAEGERPAACIVILGDTDISGAITCDHGIAAQSILLGAAERGLGGCMIGSVNRDELRRELGIPRRFNVLLVIALGKPAETVRLEAAEPGGDIRYWRDEAGVHHVPKRPLDELIVDASGWERKAPEKKRDDDDTE